MKKIVKDKRELPQGIAYTGDELNFKRPEIGEGEHKGTVTRIVNACKDCIIEANTSTVFISEDSLGEILRLRAEDKIRIILSNINEDDKYENSKYILLGECLKLINKEMNEARSESKRKYLRVSEQALINIRDCDQLRVMNGKIDENYLKDLKKLKKTRIRVYKIREDELTGESLIKRKAEFSHIRSKASYPALALDIENGLIVNKETHDKITEENVENEEKLKSLCEREKWNVEWYEKYKEKYE
ncbi:hypothetical protein [uncultured Clostridium sp.]|uniref:hypothetical protein n=1 Tax=uncultured Clostridium sp. TaxID=59620 RepID=UPI00261DB29E|nr:hypothetical protein [uncultured Clostridium sp.]